MPMIFLVHTQNFYIGIVKPFLEIFKIDWDKDKGKKNTNQPRSLSFKLSKTSEFEIS